jgi:toxin YoeB
VRICFHAHAWADYLYWQNTERKKLERINELIRAIQRNPFRGIGKPEPLRGNCSGFWSRRIDRDHRLVYAVKDDTLFVAQCRFHY